MNSSTFLFLDTRQWRTPTSHIHWWNPDTLEKVGSGFERTADFAINVGNHETSSLSGSADAYAFASYVTAER